MNLKTLSWVLRTYRFPIVAVTALFILGAIVISGLAPPLYEAKAVLIVTNKEKTAGAGVDYMSVLANKHLVGTYCEILPTAAVLNRVTGELGPRVTAEELREAITVRQLGDTELMEITVVSTSRNRAVEIADKTVRVFTSYIEDIFPFADVRPAGPVLGNKTPVSPKTSLNTTVAGLGGFLIILIWCLAVNCVRQPVSAREDFQSLSLEVLGEIPKIGGGTELEQFEKITLVASLQNVFRQIGTMVTRKLDASKTVLVTSTCEDKDQSVVCSVLAVCMAEAGRKTTVVDADFTNPIQDRLFKVKREPGLGGLTSENAVELLLQTTKWPDLKVVAAGRPLADSYRYLSSPTFEILLGRLAEQTDVLLLDGPSVVDNAAGLLLATRVDGVLMVVRPGVSREKVAEGVACLRSLQVEILGVIIQR